MVSTKFRVEQDLIFARIGKTRRERTARPGMRPASGPVPEREDPVPEEPVPAPAVRDENEILSPSEKELLRFILVYGQDTLQFETDSDFYSPDGSQTVAEFIDDALSSDGVEFANSAYRDTYRAYFDLYDQGEDQDRIIRMLLSGEDRRIAQVTAELSQEKYQLTVKNFSAALTTKDSWLVTYVPRAILAYQDKRMDAKLATLKRRLKESPPEEQVKILDEMGRVNTLKRKIKIKLGREK